MKNKQPPCKFRFPRGRFNSQTICKFTENGHSYLMPYGIACIIRRCYGGSIVVFIETVLLSMRGINPDYAIDPAYLRIQALLPPFS